MTLTLAWVRSVGQTEELVVASDSRLRPFAWDAAPKIMPLPRGDAVVAFAGDTGYAYPMMLQMLNAISSYDAAASRDQSLEDTKGHLLRVMNRMLEDLTDPPDQLDQPDAYFLLAGFSWRLQEFRIWTLHFDASIDKFTFRPATPWKGGNESKVLALVGDGIDEAKEHLANRLRSLGKLDSGGFDMEPIEVLASMIDSPNHCSIGGNIQLVKVYRSLNAVPFVVERNGVRSLLGRSLLDYELSNRYPTINL